MKNESKIISLAIFLFMLPVMILKDFLFPQWRLVLKFCVASGFAAAILFSGFLAFQINKEASERYLIGKYEKSLNALMQENQKLENQFSKANAITGASDLADKLSFEKIGQISYIRLADSKVVKK